MSSAKSLKSPASYLDAAEDLRPNAGQWKAYNSTGHYIALAGPGSGKTKVLTTKVARMLAEDVSWPRGIACITYSNECARELQRRLRAIGVQSKSNLFVGTVHSFCLKAIIQPFARLANEQLPMPLKVATDQEKASALDGAMSKHGASGSPSSWETRIGHYRRTYLDRDKPSWRAKDSDAAKIIETYEKLLHQNGLVDFDDMVLIGLRLAERHAWIRKALHARFPIIVVDEYQDLGAALHRLVMALCFDADKPSRLFAVGDPDQSIYGFTGAQPELLEGLAEDSRVESGRLRLNYRSLQRLVSASEAALGETRGYKAAAGEGGVIDFHSCPNGIDHQAETICNHLIPRALKDKAARNIGQIAVLYNDKFLGDAIASAAAERGIDFVRVDKNAPYAKTVVTRWLEGCACWCSGGWRNAEPRLSELLSTWKAFWAAQLSDSELRDRRTTLLAFLFEMRSDDSLLEDWLLEFELRCLGDLVATVPTLRDEKAHIERILNACEKNQPLSGWSLARFGGQLGGADQLKLMTLHSSKGLEFDVVCMMGLDQGTLPWNNLTAKGKREPRRLFYVGLTRARHVVHMLYSGWVTIRGSKRVFAPRSEFVEEVLRRQVPN